MLCPQCRPPGARRQGNLQPAAANCGPTTSDLKHIDAWLGDGDWDVIHFTFDIHARIVAVTETAGRLKTIVERLHRTDATLVWATTRPIPDKPEVGRRAASIVERTIAAAAVRQQRGVATDERFSLITAHLAEVRPPGRRALHRGRLRPARRPGRRLDPRRDRIAITAAGTVAIVGPGARGRSCRRRHPPGVSSAV